MVTAMIKKLISGILAAFILVQPLTFAKSYYFEREWEKVDQSELVYKTVSLDDMEKKRDELLKLLGKKGNDLEVMLLLGECYDIYYSTHNAYSIASLAADRNENEKTLGDEKASADTNIKALAILNDIIKAVYNSSYNDALSGVFGEDSLEIYIKNMPDSEIMELTNKELDLISRYTQVYGNSDECAELFCELVAVRNELAKKSGYLNYAQFADESLYSRDYTENELLSFCEGVKENIVPLYYGSVKALEMMESEAVPMTVDDVLLNARLIMGYINPELKSSFDYMIENNLYDISDSDKKSESGAYTMNMPKAAVPFIFINPDTAPETDGVALMQTLIHEFGHFSAMLNDPVATEPYFDMSYISNNETAETQSQGLEMMAEKYYGRILKSAAPFERYYNLYSITAAIIDGCILDRWQREVYSEDDISVDELNLKAQALYNEYYGIEYHPDDVKEIWTGVMHNFTMPMYYISYAVSGMQALGIYNVSVKDYDKATDIYMNISSSGIYVPFKELSQACELDNVFSSDTIERIADGVGSAYALSYSDVIDGDWYTPYLYRVSNIFDGRAENTFMPDTYITRSEFIGVIGKMYDYYVGIDGDYKSSFSDTLGNENSFYIGWAKDTGIATGYDNKTFGAQNPLTREEAATIIYRLSQDSADDLYARSFSDFGDISEWAKESVSWATLCGIINGRGNNDFDPKASITRAETAKIVSCYIESEY